MEQAVRELQDAIIAWIGAAKEGEPCADATHSGESGAGAHKPRKTTMKDIREADAGHATPRDLPYPGTTPEFERLIAGLRAEVHALKEMVQPLHDARVAEMKRQEAERERQRIAAEYRYRDCAPSRSRLLRRLGF
jgi:hypothetical protein